MAFSVHMPYWCVRVWDGSLSIRSDPMWSYVCFYMALWVCLCVVVLFVCFFIIIPVHSVVVRCALYYPWYIEFPMHFVHKIHIFLSKKSAWKIYVHVISMHSAPKYSYSSIHFIFTLPSFVWTESVFVWITKPIEKSTWTNQSISTNLLELISRLYAIVFNVIR